LGALPLRVTVHFEADMTNTTQVRIASHPVVSVWFRPKATIRQITPGILMDERPVILAGMLNGVALILNWIHPQDWSNGTLLFFAGVFGGPAFGFILLFVQGSLLRWTGSWLGGQASTLETFTALALSAVPRIGGLAVWLVLFVLVTFRVFTLDALIAIGAFRAYTVMFLLMELWSLIILLKSLSEVHRFSTVRALATLGLNALVITGPCWLVQIAGLAIDGLKSVLGGW
jgi:hypothetical protein